MLIKREGYKMYYARFKKSMLIAAFLLTIFMVGCSNTSLTPDFAESKALVICADGINQNALQYVFDVFEEEHNIEVICNWIPAPYETNGVDAKSNIEERNSYIQRIKTEIMAGQGPDIYVIPVYGTAQDVFPDVSKAMRNGVFRPLGTLEQSNISQLQAALKSVGQMEGTQYILPLSYQVDGVLLCDSPQKNRALYSTLDGLGTSDYFRTLDENYPEWGIEGIWWHNLTNNAIPLINYDTMKVDLLAQDMPELLRREVEVIQKNVDSPYQMEYYEYGALAETEKGAPYIIGQAAGDLNNLAMTILSGEGTLFSAFPNADGEIYARVTGIAGISSSCDRIREAELFVDFLLDERWQKNFNGTGTSVLSGLPARMGYSKKIFENQNLQTLNNLQCVPLSGETLESFADLEKKVAGAYFPVIPEAVIQMIDETASENSTITIDIIKKANDVLERYLSE